MNSNRVYYSNEAASQANRQKLLLALVAVGAGAVVALLMAPSSGQDMRENLSHTLEDSMSKGREVFESTVKKLESEMADLRKKVEERTKA